MKPSSNQHLVICLLLSLSLGLCVAWVPIIVAGSGLWWVGTSAEQDKTRTSLRRVERASEDYQKEHRKYAKSLEGLALVDNDRRDGWKRPWIYSVANGKPLIESLGRDGKRGGKEQNADLSNLSPRPDAARLSLWKWLIHRNVIGVTLTALIAGIIAGKLAFTDLRQVSFERANLSNLILNGLIIFACAAFGAAFIAIAHVPSGH